MTALTPVELAIMKSLWRRQQGCVRDVQTDLHPDRQLAYTTVMTVLDRLFRKGVVRRTKRSRAHVYEPVFSETEFRSEAVAGLVDDYFEGSSVALREFLDGTEPAAPPSDDGESEPRVRERARVGAIDESLL